MNRVAIVAAACAAACSAVPAQAVFLDFTVDATGTRFDAVLVPAGAPNPPGASCLGPDSVERICTIGLNPNRSFSFAQDFDLSAGVLNYDEGDIATTGRTQFTLTDRGDNTYALSLFRYSFNNRTGGGFGPGRSEALVAPLQIIDGPAAVPEPAAWATMIAGFGLIGGAMRARRRARVAFA